MSEPRRFTTKTRDDEGNVYDLGKGERMPYRDKADGTPLLSINAWTEEIKEKKAK
jgi:hypothetical protein